MPDTDNQAGREPTFAERRAFALGRFEYAVANQPTAAAYNLMNALKQIKQDEDAALAEVEAKAAEAAAEKAEAMRLREERRYDTTAIAKLRNAMTLKLDQTRKNRGGWWTENCSAASLSAMLRACVEKGDPVDVANFCAFLHSRGEKIAPRAEGLSLVTAKSLDDLDAQNKQTYADPCAGDDYLRGYNNGVRLAHATIFGHETDFILPAPGSDDFHSRPVTDESGGSVGAGVIDRVIRAECRPFAPLARTLAAMPEHLRDGYREVTPRGRTAGGFVPDYTATEVAAMEKEKEALLGPELKTSAAEIAARLGFVAKEVPYRFHENRPGYMMPAVYLVRVAEFAGELMKARRKFPTMASAHEGYAIIAEEFEELKAIVWQKQSERNYADLRKETVQLGAMVLAFLLEVVDPINRR